MRLVAFRFPGATGRSLRHAHARQGTRKLRHVRRNVDLIGQLRDVHLEARLHIRELGRVLAARNEADGETCDS